MSKITQALEKAARGRLQRDQEQPTVPTTERVRIPLAEPVVAATPSRIGEVATIGEVQIDPHIVSAADSKSPIAEQYRILKFNLQSLRLRQGPKAIVVTSALNGEGKTVTAINLALTLARQESLRVALVDADLRRSSIHRWLGFTERPKGVSTVLTNGGLLNGSLLSLQTPSLTILPSGPAVEHPAELLQSFNMKRLLAGLKTQFDLILIDTPPVLAVADTGILASQADGVLLVVRAGKTQRKTVAQAQGLLEQVKANLLGCVLTHAPYYLPTYYQYYGESKQEPARHAAEPIAAVR